MVDQDNLCLRRQRLEFWTIAVLTISASPPANSVPVAPPPTMTNVSAPWSMRLGSRSASSNALDDARPQSLGIGQGVQREGVFRGTRRAEEVRLQPPARTR